MPFAKARWVDQNGRSHEWSGYVASTDRNQAKSQIYAQTNAKKVILSSVTADDGSSYRQKVEDLHEQERSRFDEMEERLKSSGSSTNSSVRYSSSSSSSGSSMDIGSSMGLLILLGGIWAFFTYTPWILMLLYGPGSAWLTEKITGQSIEDYNDTENPTDGQHKKALAVILSAIIFGGAGFIQGSNLQKQWEVENNNQPKVEQVKNK